MFAYYPNFHRYVSLKPPAALRPDPLRRPLRGVRDMSLPPDQMIRLQTQLQREQRWRELSRASAQKSIQPLTSSVNPPFDDVSPAATSLDTLKTRLIRTISHEYRTPLTIISLAAESLAQNRTRLTVEQRQQCFRQIQQAMRRMTKLINDVLWISQAEAQEIEPHFSAIPLADFCERILEELTRLHPEWGDRLQAQVRTPFVAVPSDPFLLQQLVLQLLINALKYSEPEQPVTLELVIARAMLRIRVCDRGRGIPASECDRIYDCFYRAQNVESIAGTGLGLTIAKQCVDLLGGQIDCTSRLGQGSEFQVKLPLAVRHRRR